MLSQTKIFVGKSAINNTELVKQYIGTGFAWFHLHDLPSSHLIIEKHVKELSDEDIMVCSNMVKFYSKYKKEWTKKYKVDIVNIDNVTPEDKPGLVTIKNGKVVKIKPVFNFDPTIYNCDIKE